MNNCDNQRNKLVGKLNNSIVNLSQSFIIEDILLQENWIKKDGGYVYYYNNNIIDNKTFFIQIILKDYNLKEVLNKIQISQNILLEKQNNKNFYAIFSQNKPEMDIPITIFANEVNINKLNDNIVGVFLDLNNFSFEEIENIINDALDMAKESGEFDGPPGKDGYTPIKGVDYFDGIDGTNGEPGRGIINTSIDETGNLHIFYSDGTNQTLSKIVGSTWFSGTEITDDLPISDVPGAKVGDFYLNTNNGIIYKAMENNKWSSILSIIGKDGKDGQDGKDGKDGQDGKSAYQSAKDGGYEEDETKFNEDLSKVSSRMPNIKEMENISKIKNNDSFVIGDENKPYKITWENIANHIVQSILNNYYTEEEVNELLSKLPKFNIQVVDVLPETNQSNTTIYLLKSSKQTNNLYTEYIYIFDKNLDGTDGGYWEKLGEQTLDLSQYATKDYVLNTIPQQTGIKYVKDYRKDGMTDDEVIKTALHNLNNYETLVFEKDYNYTITNPIYLTEIGENEYADRMGNNFIGNYCTISINSQEWIKNNSSHPMIYLSDNEPTHSNNTIKILPNRAYIRDKGNGLYACQISQFIFKFNNLDDTNNTNIKALAVRSCEGSLYINECMISHCKFYNGIGMYICGFDNEVCYNYFKNCYSGIYDDGGQRDNIHNNYFFATTFRGIDANLCYECNISQNTFYDCSKHAILVQGAQPRMRSDLVYNKTTIEKNVIMGTLSTPDNRNGIGCYGCKGIIISNNYIQNVISANDDIGFEDFGYGILISGGYYNTESCRISQQVIVSNNIIRNTMRSGIRVRYAAEVEVINNHIVGCNIYPEEPINYSITGVHISLSTRIIASNNYIENYPLNNNSAINGIVVSLPYGNISDIILNNNTYYSGLVFADTVRATKYSDDFYKELIDMPEEKDEQTLIIIPNANYKTTLVPESKYTIWIPGENSDGSGNFNKIYYNGHTYNIINDLNETTEINPINDFTNFIFTKNSFQIINEQGGNSLWKKLYSNTDIKMSTIN